MRRKLGTLCVIVLIIGPLVASKPSDADILARIGAATAQRIRSELPNPVTIAGPFVALRPGDVLPEEELVRIRIHTDRTMEGTDITVLPGEKGEVKLRGIVTSPTQRDRAGQLASGTVGVTKVLNEIAVPE
ncbi:MAG: BON domain-containing protein [Bacteroidales bacterium]|nr:BON domain-containing protein [Bacteroidales bacterium]